MILSEAQKLLDSFLEHLISPLGFRRTACLKYARSANEAIAQLSFPCRVDARGFAAFTMGIGLRFESLHKWLDDNPADMRSTVGTPIHFLREDRNFTEWKFSGSDDLETLREAILRDLNEYALPFIEKYSRVAELRKMAESSRPQDWIGLNVDSRILIVAAIQLVQGDISGAANTLDEALVERDTALPKRRFEIENLRRRLAETS